MGETPSYNERLKTISEWMDLRKKYDLDRTEPPLTQEELADKFKEVLQDESILAKPKELLMKDILFLMGKITEEINREYEEKKREYEENNKPSEFHGAMCYCPAH